MRSLSQFLQGISALCIALFPLYAHATTPTFSNLSQTQMDQITKEFSSDFAYSTVTPASGLGGLGGFEFGAAGGITKDPNIHGIVETAAPGTSFPSILPHGGGLLRMGLPYGFTVEALIFPKSKISSVSYSDYGGSLMWTATDSVLSELPLSLAAKAFYTKANVSYTQNITDTTLALTVPGTVTFSDSVWGLQAIASKSILFFEPYVSVGYEHGNANLSLNTTAITTNFFSTGATTTALTSKPGTAMFSVGSDFRIAFFSLGAEYQNCFGSYSATGRLSFRF